jgi:pyridoxine kinase
VRRVAAIHDLSGFGRSSLAVVIPILSTMEVQVCSLPTAVLSAHTVYPEYCFVDLTEYMEEFIKHWKKLKLEFDCIYSGFLGSPRQINIISGFIDTFSANRPLIVIDPVMGDNGRLYATMDAEMVENMKRLIRKADIITPNFTEAAYLLDEPYNPAVTEEELKTWLKRLSAMGPDKVIITSAPSPEGGKYTSVIAYDRAGGDFWKVSCVYIPANFPGTGDAFTSVIVGSLLQGDSLPLALDRGVQFITAAIQASFGSPEQEGVLLERVLDNLRVPVLTTTYQQI